MSYYDKSFSEYMSSEDSAIFSVYCKTVDDVDKMIYVIEMFTKQPTILSLPRFDNTQIFMDVDHYITSTIRRGENDISLADDYPAFRSSEVYEWFIGTYGINETLVSCGSVSDLMG